MPAISKPFFYERISDEIQCRHLHIWEENCLKANLLFSYTVFWGAMRFFLPIYVVKAIINHKKMKEKTFWKNLLAEEVRSAFYGVLFGSAILTVNCVLCKVSGRINYYNIGLISGLISGLSMMIETKENKLLDTLIMFNLLIEAVLRNLNYSNILPLTNSRETVMFMAVSALLMHLLQNREKGRKLTNFWFYTPHILNQYDSDSKGSIEYKCSHKDTCEQFAFKGVQKYLLLGYLFAVVRKFIPRMMTIFRKPSSLYSVLIHKENLRFGTFIGAYVGIYRYVICYLLKTKTFDQNYYGAIAGLISGATYAISPSLQVLTVGITTILQVFYNKMLRGMRIKNEWPQQLVYMLSHSLLFHNAIMLRETCPAYYINMLDTCTNNMYSTIYNEIILKYGS